MKESRAYVLFFTFVIANDILKITNILFLKEFLQMKKQDLFLCAYIVFIMICIIVHQTGNYPMWESTVAAVSFSSMFLAYADVFMAISKGYSKACDTGTTTINIMGKRLRAEKEAIEEISTLIRSVPEDKGNISEMKNAFADMRKKHEELKIEFSVFETENKKFFAGAKGSERLSNTMYFFGFLSFLCILVFYPITEETNELQTLVSVIAFVIVLSTQLCDSVLSTAIEKRKKRAENKNSNLNKKLEELENVKQKVRDFVEAVNN